MSNFILKPGTPAPLILFTDDYTQANTQAWARRWIELQGGASNDFNYLLDSVNDELDIVGIFGGSTDMHQFAPAALGVLQNQQSQFARATIETAPGGGTNGFHISVFNANTMQRGGQQNSCYGLEIGPEGAASYRLRKYSTGFAQANPITIATLATIVNAIAQGDTFELRGIVNGANLDFEVRQNGVLQASPTDAGAANGFGFGIPGMFYRTNTLNTSVLSSFIAGEIAAV